MAFLSVSGVTRSFGDRTVLAGVSFHLSPGEKVGLIGANGSGKTTLLKIIAGELTAEQGEIFLSKQAIAGYLPQKPPLLERKTLRHHLEHAQQTLRDLALEVNRLENDIAGCSPGEEGRLGKLLDHYGEISGQFQQQGGYDLDRRLQSVARGLGFRQSDLDRELGSFSGGEKTRAKLAALLLQNPDLLLLDEPTNYLDGEGLEWLEKHLIDRPQALLVVTHDRFFLDRVVGRILLLDRGSVKSYSGNYSDFHARREEEQLALARAYSKQQTALQKEEKFIREAKADERSKRQASSRRKRLQKMELLEQPERGAAFHLDLRYGGRSGRKVIEFDEVGKGFTGRPLFENVSFEIRWGDRVALIGSNGVGKTTLLRLITGEERPTSGRIKIGSSVKTAYFSQEQEKLDPRRTLLEEITFASGLTIPEARRHLGRYLFSGDEVFKPIAHLSGGEKCRLALARLELIDSNCLLLDEPTSHLDLVSLEELEQALTLYPGTLLIVSHDRYFLNSLVNRVFALTREGLSIYDCSYQDYIEQLPPAAERAAKTATAPQILESCSKKVKGKTRPSPEFLRRQREARRIKERQEELEEKIAVSEQEVASLERQLADPHLYTGDYSLVEQLHEKLRAEHIKMKELLKHWEKISGELEALSSGHN